MYLVAEKSNAEHTPLAFQLDVPWESATREAKSECWKSQWVLSLGVQHDCSRKRRLYECLTFQRGDVALFGSRSADDGQQKCQDLGAQDTYPQYLRIQVSNSRTNEASRTARKVHPLASGKQENMRNCMVLEPYQKRSYTLIVRASIWENLTIFLSLPIDHTFTKTWPMVAGYWN